MYCIRTFLPLLLMPFPSTAPYFVILYAISLYRHHRPCVYCILTVILLFTTTCYWGADRCWIDLNGLRIFDPIRHMDGSPISTFGLQLPAFMDTFDDQLERLLRILGGGEPIAKVIRAGSDFAVKSTTTAVIAVSTATATATATVADGSIAATVVSSTISSPSSSLPPTLSSVAEAVVAVLLSAAGVAK
ncbi:hypothetical protein BX616_006882 [Lobosporangium transversale]|uniref:Uncharacterized protein n=1 Tax=Lobosporangium transversale TaxID=64571 RepID=A0A1Y2GM68_9FUNG|nr:hypothetical protein BCR41DRAFT_422446 [Lobosporangium transversale]KAF9915103.1 hypothetical protein BX616_006882 [Lobosporangium transversale]ORZ14951.1 hypothetical protein BCR41DRAFT_422446 [Lobosporangium transversale]|eukprot:XP_021881083.1 hypothetical protein BCR41DRAFT_422446 [Lobosporangium transversale]